MRKAAKRHNFSRSTLSRHKNNDSTMRLGAKGRKPYLTPEQAEELNTEVTKAYDRRMPPKIDKFRLMAARIKFGYSENVLKDENVVNRLNQKLPSLEWAKKFVANNPQMKQLREKPVSSAHAFSYNRTAIEDFFKNLKMDPNQYHPSLVFAMDETFNNLTTVNGRFRMRVIVPSDTKGAYNITFEKEPEHQTLIVAYSADGQLLKTGVVLPLKYLPRNLVHLFVEEHPKDIVFCGSKSGWIDTIIYRNWIVQVLFRKVLEERLKLYVKDSGFGLRTLADNLETELPRLIQSYPAKIYLDGHGTRLDYESSRMCLMFNILVVILPAHTTPWLCVLDVKHFDAMKKMAAKCRDDYVGLTPAKIRPIMVKKCSEMSSNSLHTTVNPKWIQGSRPIPRR
ncbi:MAG: hypothetical protein ACX93J_15945 [Flagellimonas marinaquae]